MQLCLQKIRKFCLGHSKINLRVYLRKRFLEYDKNKFVSIFSSDRVKILTRDILHTLFIENGSMKTQRMYVTS